ncbi:hypothetical protein [Streptomyces sp. NPDC002328]|uniref:hypothetical protein n=1 Tax=Streptomyces sp. NPDC002328 TaxID=3364642 RepID=UPI00368CC4FA
MSTLVWLAFAAGLLAVLVLLLGASDAWFCGLLALCALLGGADAAYRERTVAALALLLGGAMLAGAAVYAVVIASRERSPR